MNDPEASVGLMNGAGEKGHENSTDSLPINSGNEQIFHIGSIVLDDASLEAKIFDAPAEENFDSDNLRGTTALALVELQPTDNSTDDCESCHLSPLMADPSDSSLLKNNGSDSLTCEDISFDRCLTSRGDDFVKNTRATLTKKSRQSTLVQNYRAFLHKHEPSLDLLERIMERFVFYRYLFRDNQGGTAIEIYYTCWNVLRWINDIVLVGLGEGMGVTYGTLEEWTWNSTKNEDKFSTHECQDWYISKIQSIIPVLRAFITATTCMHPAIEAWSRRSTRSFHSTVGTALPFNENSQQQEEWNYATTVDPSPKTRRLQWIARQGRAIDSSYRLEKIRFVARFALLSISWWATRQRKHLADFENPEQKVGCSVVPPLLRKGGELDPFEEMLPLDKAEAEAANFRYVGKRTGRRLVSTTCMVPSNQLSGNSLVRYLSDRVSANRNVLCFHFIGELLHIIRPLYWSYSERTEWKRKQLTAQSGASFSNKLWKAWFISLIMDIVSDEVLEISTGFKSRRASNEKMFRSGGLQPSRPYDCSSGPQSVQQIQQEELQWRQSRRILYLIRSPAYDTVTLPIVTTAAKLITMIPSFGLGKYAADYITDLLCYYNENKFMQV